jgi:hypothetical protein
MDGLKTEDRQGLELVRSMARGEQPWNTGLIPSLVGTQVLALTLCQELERNKKYEGRIPDPAPLRVLAESAADRLLAGTGTAADWRSVAEYCTDQIRANILDR